MKPALPALPTVLLLACVGLGVSLIVEVNRPVKLPPMPELPPASGGAAAQEQPAFIAPPEQEFAEVAARPVFVMARRPAPPPASPPARAMPIAAPAPPPPAPPPVAAKAITVLGIVGAPAKRIALLRPPDTSTVLNVVEGGSVAGWRVVTILADRVVLRWNATEEEISFPRPGGQAGMQSSAPTRPPSVTNRRP